MTDQTEVIAVNRAAGLILLSNDLCVPVSGWMDDEGNDCDEKEAVTCWAKEAEDSWWAVDLSEFIAHPTQ